MTNLGAFQLIDQHAAGQVFCALAVLAFILFV